MPNVRISEETKGFLASIQARSPLKLRSVNSAIEFLYKEFVRSSNPREIDKVKVGWRKYYIRDFIKVLERERLIEPFNNEEIDILEKCLEQKYQQVVAMILNRYPRYKSVFLDR